MFCVSFQMPRRPRGFCLPPPLQRFREFPHVLQHLHHLPRGAFLRAEASFPHRRRRRRLDARKKSRRRTTRLDPEKKSERENERVFSFVFLALYGSRKTPLFSSSSFLPLEPPPERDGACERSSSSSSSSGGGVTCRGDLLINENENVGFFSPTQKDITRERERKKKDKKSSFLSTI